MITLEQLRPGVKVRYCDNSKARLKANPGSDWRRYHDEYGRSTGDAPFHGTVVEPPVSHGLNAFGGEVHTVKVKFDDGREYSLDVNMLVSQ